MSTPKEKFEGFASAVKALPDEAQKDLRKIVAYGQAEDLTVGQTRKQITTYIDNLPAHLQSQLKNGIVDIDGLLPEQLRGLAIDAAIDGEVASLAFALRGDTSSSMNNWKAVTADGGAQVDPAQSVSPSDTPTVAEDKQKQGKPPLVGV